MNLLAEVMKAKKAFMKKDSCNRRRPFPDSAKAARQRPYSVFRYRKAELSHELLRNERVQKAHLGYELHESKDAHNYAMKLLMHMLDYTKKLSEEPA